MRLGLIRKAGRHESVEAAVPAAELRNAGDTPAITVSVRTGPPVRLGLCSGKSRRLLKIDYEYFA
ncbi:MAG: hypothetical protein DMF03_01420 [Verrucomicrobia bacterium]|nr:MAG: hypothetical protein DMF03_01420 [Verrucomicrobiota bacterium]